VGLTDTLQRSDRCKMPTRAMRTVQATRKNESLPLNGSALERLTIGRCYKVTPEQLLGEIALFTNMPRLTQHRHHEDEHLTKKISPAYPMRQPIAVSRYWPAASAGSLHCCDCLEATVEQCVIQFLHGTTFVVLLSRIRTDRCSKHKWPGEIDSTSMQRLPSDFPCGILQRVWHGYYSYGF
jgi:hypothetical protein